MSMMRVIVSITLFLMLSASTANGAQCDDRYETIIFPTGLPSSPGWDGRSHPTRFKCHTEAILSENVKAIIFSKEVLTGAADNLYEVKLAVISFSGGAKKVANIVDLTRFIPVYLEMPGNFHKVNAVIEALKGHDGSKILHVNLWAVLSGSGAISGSCDLFYIYNLDRSLSLALELRNSGYYSKENIANIARKTSQVFLIATSKGTCIYVQTDVLLMKGLDKTTSSRSITKYLLVRRRFMLAGTDAKVPSTALKLERVPEITMLMMIPSVK